MLSSRFMRIPVIPIAVATTLMGVVATLIVLTPSGKRRLAAPSISRIGDVDGMETDVAIAPDGIRYAVIASGNLWFTDSENGIQRKLTDTVEIESSPNWTPDGTAITFTRKNDTFLIRPDGGDERLFLQAATDLAWSSTGRTAFLRNGGLWVGDASGGAAREIVPPNENPDVVIRGPRFSPSGNQILFILSMLNLNGELWVADASTGEAIPIIADRKAENPLSADWILDNRHIAYLTDRGGSLAVWYVDLDQSLLLPVTEPMMGRSFGVIGIAVHENRVVLPRHFMDSDIRIADGRPLVGGPRLEFDPAASRDGTRIAYTVENESRFEIWVADSDGSNPLYVALGRHPRFSPSGNEIVYARTDLDGNRDIWKVDIRTGLPEQLTDAPEIDDVPDWSPDGRSIVFSSEWNGRMSVWTVPSSGGQRLRLNAGGFAPRYSPDGRHIAYWKEGGVWTSRTDGSQPARVGEAAEPTFAVWGPSGPSWAEQGHILPEGVGHSPFPIWPPFDRLDDHDWVVAAIEVGATELWAIDLLFEE